MPKCPSREELRDFSLGLLPEAALARVSDHTETCRRCLAALSTLDDANDSLLSALRRSSEGGDPLRDDSGCREAVAEFERVGSGRARAPSAAKGPAAVPPRQFGRYDLLEKLGHGGMGTVYLARDKQLDRQVALKIPHFGPEDNPTLRERFYREARAAASIVHPNLCPVYDVGEIGGLPYLSMAYVQGRPLSNVLRDRGRFPEQRAAELVRKLALALAEAHARDVVHRDVKPSNVMLSEEGEPILTDFGLARRIEVADPRLTHSGLIVGTPTYMAPEQVDRDPEKIDPRCDVYSLGVLLYELLTGDVPFRGPLLSVLTKLGKAEPEPPSQRRPGLDPRLESICLKAMAKRPANRYQSAADLASALQGYFNEPPEPGVSPPRRAGPLLLAAVAVAGFLSLAAAVTVRLKTDEGTLVLTVDQPDAEVTIDGNRVHLQSPREEILLKVGSHGLAVKRDGFRTFTRGFTIKRGRTTEIAARWEPSAKATARPPPKARRIEDGKLLPAGGRFGLGVALSGKYVLVGAPGHSGSGSVHVFDAGTGTERFTLAPDDKASMAAFGWSVACEGDVAVVGDPESGRGDPGCAYLFDLRTRRQLRKLTAKEPEPEADFGGHVAISGNLALVGSIWAGGSGRAYLFDVTTGELLSVIRPSDGESGDLFGKVSIRGRLAAIGAGQGGKNAPGAVYLYDVSRPRAPVEVAKVVASDGAPGDRFGSNPAINGHLLLVGAPKDDDRGKDSGSAYLFDLSDPASPRLLAKLAPPDAGPGAHFGVGTAMDGHFAVVGARGAKTGPGAVQTGAAYSFDLSDPSKPRQLRKIVPPDGAAGDLFGYSVDLQGTTAAVSAREHDAGGSNSGAVYLCDVRERP